MKRTSFLLNLPIMIAAPAVSLGANSVTQFPPIEIRPNQDPGIEGVTYHSLWASLPVTEKVQYGTPLLIQVTAQDEKIYFDIGTSEFDDIVVRVPLEELLSMPNRDVPDAEY